MSFIEIASKEGSMYTKWGPCFCHEGAGHEVDPCIACQNANEIEAGGLDYDEEYQKAKLRGFDS